jgi:putative transposase
MNNGSLLDHIYRHNPLLAERELITQVISCILFVTKLEHKAEWFGKTILRIGPFEPSSKLCNVCGYHNKELQLKDREWQCPACKTKHDRDINAAINIKKFALIDQNLIGL